MHYLYTHPLATSCFRTSDMVLSLVSDAAYCVFTNAKSCCATKSKVLQGTSLHPVKLFAKLRALH